MRSHCVCRGHECPGGGSEGGGRDIKVLLELKGDSQVRGIVGMGSSEQQACSGCQQGGDGTQIGAETTYGMFAVERMRVRRWVRESGQLEWPSWMKQGAHLWGPLTSPQVLWGGASLSSSDLGVSVNLPRRLLAEEIDVSLAGEQGFWNP